MKHSRTPVALTHEELRALLSVTRDHDLRVYVLFLISVCHGLRVSEAIALRKSNFKSYGDVVYITVERLKGSEESTQKLNRSSEILLDEQTVVAKWIENIPSNGLLFTDADGGMLSRHQVTRMMAAYCKLANIPSHKAFPHVFKHTLGVLLRQSGADVAQIKSALGHKDVNSSMAYMRLSTDEVDDIRERAFTGELKESNAFAAAAGGRTASAAGLMNSGRTVFERPETIYE
jgi:integrase